MPSLAARALSLALRLYLRPRLLRGTVAERRAQIAATAARRRLPNGFLAVPVSAGAVPAEWLEGPGLDRSRVLYHVHGGGFSGGSAASERPLTLLLSRAVESRGFGIDYRLAPEHPFPAAVEDAVAAYRWLLDQGADPRRTIVSGASAGGNIALSALLSLRDAGGPLPAGVVLLSPSTDLTLSGESFVTKARLDPIITRAYAERASAMYASAAERRNPLLSPHFADLRGLPPMLVHAGSIEVMLSDATRLADRAKEAGVDVTLRVWEGLFHVFHAAAFLPESRAAMREIGTWARQRLEPTVIMGR